MGLRPFSAMLNTLERVITFFSSHAAPLRNFWANLSRSYSGVSHSLKIWYEPFMLGSELFYIPFKLEADGGAYNRQCSKEQAIHQIFLCADSSDATILSMITNVNPMVRISEFDGGGTILLSFHDSNPGALHFERFDAPGYVPPRQPQHGELGYW